MNAAKNAALIRALYEGPKSYEDLMEITDLRYATILSHLQALRAVKMLYWGEKRSDNQGNRQIKTFFLKRGPNDRDVKPFKQFTASEKMKLYRQRQKEKAACLQQFLSPSASSPSS